MKIQTLVLDNDEDDLQRLKELLADKQNITYVQTTTAAIEAIKSVKGDPIIIVTDYYLDYPDTGLTFMKQVIPMGFITHFMFMSNKPTVQILDGIIALRWGFSFKDKNDMDFERWLVSELGEVQKALTHKMELVIKMEKEQKERERHDKELRDEAIKALKIIEGNGANRA